MIPPNPALLAEDWSESEEQLAANISQLDEEIFAQRGYVYLTLYSIVYFIGWKRDLDPNVLRAMLYIMGVGLVLMWTGEFMTRHEEPLARRLLGVVIRLGSIIGVVILVKFLPQYLGFPVQPYSLYPSPGLIVIVFVVFLSFGPWKRS